MSIELNLTYIFRTLWPAPPTLITSDGWSASRADFTKLLLWERVVTIIRPSLGVRVGVNPESNIQTNNFFD